MKPEICKKWNQIRRHSTLSLACIVLLLFAGCAPKIDSGTGVISEKPDYDLILKQQADRIKKLTRFESRGIIELKWRDDKGKHFEQGDIRLLIGLPGHLALSVNKQASDPFIWLGANDKHFWFFDMLDKDNKVVLVGAFSDIGDDASIPGVIHPKRLIDLTGLSPIPADAKLVFDEEASEWSVRIMGQGGPMRVYFDSKKNWPKRVDSLSETGEVLYQSLLTHYESVPIRGLPPGDFPKLAHRIEIHDMQEDSLAIVRLEDPDASLSEEKLLRACDFDRLREGLRPDKVQVLQTSDDSQ